MFKTKKSLKQDYEVLYKDWEAKAKQIDELVQRLSDAEMDALKATEQLKQQEHNNAMLQQQMERKSCDGCIHSANYRKCTSCARYPKLKDKWEAKE